ncbi:MAG: PLDc N-terminal domain-containing protein [Chloroflexia bacterium]
MDGSGGFEVLFSLFFVALWGGIMLLSLGAAALWIWMLIDCATKEPEIGNERVTWILVVALTGAVGAIIYFFVRRPQRIRMYGR